MPRHDRFPNGPDRRSVIRGFAGGVLGAGLGAGQTRVLAASPAPRNKDNIQPNPLAASFPIWRLDRPKAALPSSYFWTWDHSTNWMWDDPGILNFGCVNRYLKQSATYVEDYRRLTDMAAGLGVKGILVWGFLRDAHGGIGSAKHVADYAASKDIAIMPGIGTNFYGGIYYEGDHPYNIETFVKKHPEASMINAQGNSIGRSVCPSHPAFTEWLQKGVEWLFREFSIGGANLENGDFMVCHCPRCKEAKENWPKADPEFWRFQYLGYDPALQTIKDQLKNKLVTWATYTGFTPASMKCQRPALLDKLPPEGIAQWTLTGMLSAKPLPLTSYLDNGAPREALSNPHWTAEIKPLAKRNVGFIHQGSQWAAPPRYEQVVSIIKGGCLMAYVAGLEGVSIHGEVSSMHVPWALNYLAFSHFIHWPEDSLRQFGKKTLGQVLGSEQEGEAFAELFAHWEAGSLTNAQKKDIQGRSQNLQSQVSGGSDPLIRWRFWNWLMHMAMGTQDRQTAGVF